MARTVKISKTKANECANVVVKYAKQEAKKNVKKGAKATGVMAKKTGVAASKVAKAGFTKLKGLFSK